MSFVVDTDTCSAYIKGHRLAYNRFLHYGGRLYISLIAATALVHGYTVATHNTADFQTVPGLNVVDWLVP